MEGGRGFVIMWARAIALLMTLMVSCSVHGHSLSSPKFINMDETNQATSASALMSALREHLQELEEETDGDVETDGDEKGEEESSPAKCPTWDETFSKKKESLIKMCKRMDNLLPSNSSSLSECEKCTFCKSMGESEAVNGDAGRCTLDHACLSPADGVDEGEYDDEERKWACDDLQKISENHVSFSNAEFPGHPERAIDTDTSEISEDLLSFLSDSHQRSLHVYARVRSGGLWVKGTWYEMKENEQLVLDVLKVLP